MLLQTELSSKAQRTYAALAIKDCRDYEIIKAAILKELVPEAYRQKLSGCKNQRYVEFSKYKEGRFDRWCHSKNINGSYERN